MPIEVKSVIESKLEKICGVNLVEEAKQFVDTDGKTIKEVLHSLYLVQEQYTIDWEAILTLAEQTNGKELLPEPIMEKILMNRQLELLVSEIFNLSAWVDGIPDRF